MRNRSAGFPSARAPTSSCRAGRAADPVTRQRQLGTRRPRRPRPRFYCLQNLLRHRESETSKPRLGHRVRVRDRARRAGRLDDELVRCLPGTVIHSRIAEFDQHRLAVVVDVVVDDEDTCADGCRSRRKGKCVRLVAVVRARSGGSALDCPEVDLHEPFRWPGEADIEVNLAVGVALRRACVVDGESGEFVARTGRAGLRLIVIDDHLYGRRRHVAIAAAGSAEREDRGLVRGVLVLARMQSHRLRLAPVLRREPHADLVHRNVVRRRPPHPDQYGPRRPALQRHRKLPDTAFLDRDGGRADGNADLVVVIDEHLGGHRRHAVIAAAGSAEREDRGLVRGVLVLARMQSHRLRLAPVLRREPHADLVHRNVVRRRPPHPDQYGSRRPALQRHRKLPDTAFLDRDGGRADGKADLVIVIDAHLGGHRRHAVIAAAGSAEREDRGLVRRVLVLARVQSHPLRPVPVVRREPHADLVHRDMVRRRPPHPDHDGSRRPTLQRHRKPPGTAFLDRDGGRADSKARCGPGAAVGERAVGCRYRHSEHRGQKRRRCEAGDGRGCRTVRTNSGTAEGRPEPRVQVSRKHGGLRFQVSGDTGPDTVASASDGVRSRPAASEALHLSKWRREKSCRVRENSCRKAGCRGQEPVGLR